MPDLICACCQLRTDCLNGIGGGVCNDCYDCHMDGSCHGDHGSGPLYDHKCEVGAA